MKKILMMLVMSVMVLNVLEASAVPKGSIGITFDLARPKKDCKSGLWICRIKTTATLDGVVDEIIDRLVSGMITNNTDGTVKIEFQSPLMEKGNFFAERGEEVLLPAEISKALGYNSVTLIPGNYPVQSDGKYGYVIIPIKTN